MFCRWVGGKRLFYFMLGYLIVFFTQNKFLCFMFLSISKQIIFNRLSTGVLHWRVVHA